MGAEWENQSCCTLIMQFGTNAIAGSVWYKMFIKSSFLRHISIVEHKIKYYEKYGKINIVVRYVQKMANRMCITVSKGLPIQIFEEYPKN